MWHTIDADVAVGYDYSQNNRQEATANGLKPAHFIAGYMNFSGGKRLLILIGVCGTAVLISLVTIGTLTAAGDIDDDGLTVAEELEAGTEITTADTDGDGLDDGAEVSGSTDPTNPDTDGDGLDDGEEVHRYGTDPTVRDTDGDGLSDLEESNGPSDPTQADTDGDGLDDGREQERGTDPSSADTDGDGLEDSEELDRGTDPLAGDSDDDGLEDGAEIDHGTDPLDEDSDGDGLEDGAEIEAGADPNDRDTDGDGLNDGQEVRVRPATDPTDPDTDSDGLTDRQEIEEYDTDPNDADTDDDSLQDGREIEIGTDPTDEDTDGDQLLDGWEVQGVGDGTEFPDADPLRMDLYIQVNHGSQFDGIDSTTRYEIFSQYAEMPVTNPDGTTGIRAHVIDGDDAGQPLVYDGNNFDELEDVGDALRGSRTPHYRSVLIVDMSQGGRTIGLANTPGDFSIVAGNPTTASRSQTIVHETLHNVVGRIEADGVCADDPAHYCEGGFLEPVAGPGNNYLPAPIGDQIEQEGFEPPEITIGS